MPPASTTCRSGRPGDEHDAVLQVRDVAQLGRKAQVVEARNVVRNHAHHHRVGAALPEDVDPEARLLRQRIRKVARSRALERRLGVLVLTDQVVGDLRRMFGQQDRQSIDANPGQPAVQFDLGRAAGRKHQITGAFHTDHRRNQRGRVDGYLLRRRGAISISIRWSRQSWGNSLNFRQDVLHTYECPQHSRPLRKL